MQCLGTTALASDWAWLELLSDNLLLLGLLVLDLFIIFIILLFCYFYQDWFALGYSSQFCWDKVQKWNFVGTKIRMENFVGTKFRHKMLEGESLEITFWCAYMTAGVHLLNFPSDFGVSLFCSCDGSSSQESDRRRSRWAEGGDGEWIDLHHTGRYGHRFYASWACVVFSDVTCSCVVFHSCVSVVLLMAVSCFSYVSCSYIYKCKTWLPVL